MKIQIKPNDLTIWRNHDPVSIHTIFPEAVEFNIDVSQTQVITWRNSLVPDNYPMTSRNHFVGTLENIINDSFRIEIPKQVMDVLRTSSISNWTSEPYHQNLNLVEWKYRTIKLLTNTLMHVSHKPSNYWLLCIIYVGYLLNHKAYSKYPKIPDHRLTIDRGECGSPTRPSEGENPKAISTRVPNGFFSSRCDQDSSAVKLTP